MNKNINRIINALKKAPQPAPLASTQAPIPVSPPKSDKVAAPSKPVAAPAVPVTPAKPAAPQFITVKQGQDIVRVPISDVKIEAIAPNVERKTYTVNGVTHTETNYITPPKPDDWMRDYAAKKATEPQIAICKPTFQIVPEHYLISYFKGACWIYDYRSCKKYLVLHQDWIVKTDVQKKDGNVVATLTQSYANHLSADEVNAIIKAKLPLTTIKAHYLVFIPRGCPPEHYSIKALYDSADLDFKDMTKVW